MPEVTRILCISYAGQPIKILHARRCWRLPAFGVYVEQALAGNDPSLIL